MSYHIFEKGSDLLPAFSKPYTDESLSSWLTRLSFDHGLNRSALLKFIGADSNYHQGDWGIDRVFNGKKIHALASHTNCSAAEIQETTLMYYHGKLFNASAHNVIPPIWTVKSYHEESLLKPDAKTNTLFCPSCFSKKDTPIYYKKQWRLSISFVCPDCECYLMDHCPHYKKGSSGMNAPEVSARTIDDYFLECSKCGNDISACVPRRAPKHIIEMQSQINKYLKNGCNETGQGSVEYFKLLYKITALLLIRRKKDNLGAFIKHLYTLHNVVDFNPKVYNLHIAKLPLKLQAEVFSMASWLLSEWPNRFIGLCKKYHLSSADILRRCSDTPDWFEYIVRSHLDVFSDGRWRSRVRYRYQATTELDTYSIRCNNHSDYDYDADEAYYSGNPDNFIMGYTRYPLKSHHCATDLIYHQLKKAEGWS